MSGQAIVLAKHQFPRLCNEGLYPYRGTASRPIDPAQVETAIAYLAMLTPTKTPRIGSGTLKHYAENWGKGHGLSSYISRGALTAAAVALGLAVRGYGPLFAMNPHIAIGVSLKDVKRINTAMPRKTKRGYGQ
jgi:hypothetical protein